MRSHPTPFEISTAADSHELTIDALLFWASYLTAVAICAAVGWAAIRFRQRHTSQRQ